MINIQKSTLLEVGFLREEILSTQASFPFHLYPMDEGLKYFRFNLKPNDYNKFKRLSLLANIEKLLKG